FALSWVAALPALGHVGRDGRDNRQVVQDFLAALKVHPEVNPEQLKQIEGVVSQAAARSPSEALTEGLMALYPDYADAVRAAESGADARQLSSLRGMAESRDRFLAADASFYLARALVNQERFEESLPWLSQLTGDLTNYSTQTSSSAYYTGVAYAGMLRNQEAIVAWLDFLDRFPDAPERLRVSAWRQIQQLQAIQEGKLDDVHQRMDFSRRRLEIIETGDRTQEEQDNIVKMLAKLIKEAEKKECSSCSGKKNSESQQEQQAQQQPAPQENSQSQQGGMSNVANGRFTDRNFDAGFESDWSRLRDRSRDPANAGLKDKLPARYRDIVERYFDALNDNQ
ncbi:MAG TPA: hypothetical protein PKD54_14855, partial [Pirellulaceae bacterium]|nr:hypothetical protein [Pirellulaceae bacterium]